MPSPAIPPGMDPKAWRLIIDAIAEEAADLAVALQSGKPLGKGMASRIRSLKAQADAMRALVPWGKTADADVVATWALKGLIRPMREAGDALKKSLPAHALAAAQELEDFAKANGFTATGNPEALQATAARFTQAITHDWERLTADTQQQIRSGVARGMVGGKNPREVARAVKGAVTEAGAMTYSRARLIAQTEMGDLYDSARLQTMANNEDIFGGWWWRARPDACPICQIKHGMIHETAEPTNRHHNCFPAGTMVQAPDRLRGFARHYEGPMVRVTMASGQVLTATPNHPVLTARRGWQPLGAVTPSDDLVRYVGDGDERRADAQDVPAPIEQVVHALAEEGVSVAQGTAGDFHGDGTEGDVHVVGADRLLAHERHAPLLERQDQRPLIVRDVAEAGLPVGGPAHPFHVTHAPTPAGLVGGPQHVLAFLGRGLTPPSPHRLAAVPWSDLGQQQPTPDHVPADLVAEGQRLLGRAGTVVADRVREVVWDRQWSGHVFNLETRKGWYLAQGYVTGNCRCVMVPIVGDPPGPPGSYMPGEKRSDAAIYHSLSPSMQEKVKAHRWPEDADGNPEVDYRELLGLRTNNGWRDSLTLRAPGEGKPWAPDIKTPADPWLGKPAPVQPKAPEPLKPFGKEAFDPLLQQAKDRYAALGTGKSLEQSYNWSYFQKFMDTTDLGALDTLVNGKYIDPADRTRWIQAAAKAQSYDPDLLAAWNKAQAKYFGDLDAWKIDYEAWKAANGVTHEWVGLDGALQHATAREGVAWADVNIPPPGGTATGRAGLKQYTGSSYREMNTALRDAWWKGEPLSPAHAKKFAAMDEAMVECPEHFVVGRGTSFAEFRFPPSAGEKIADPKAWGFHADAPPPDPLSLVGTVQHQPSYISTSVGPKGAFGGDVVMRIITPKGTRLSWAKPYSHFSSENEVLVGRGHDLFIHAVYQEGRQWIVEAELLLPGTSPLDALAAGVKPGSRPAI